MACDDCNFVWIINRKLNESLAKTEERAQRAEDEALSARMWASKEATKVIRELREEVAHLKARLHD